jgi:hypothetical protein
MAANVLFAWHVTIFLEDHSYVLRMKKGFAKRDPIPYLLPATRK